MDNSSVDSFALVPDPLAASYDQCSTLATLNGEIPVRFKFSKSQVYIHPSANSDTRICGNMYLVEALQPAPHRYIVAWLPEDGPSEYEIWTPVTEIRSVKISPPSLSNWLGKITINFRDGHSCVPLCFHDAESSNTMLQKKTQGGKYNSDSDHRPLWGGDEFIHQLSQLIHIEPSENEKDRVYLVAEQPSETGRPASSKSASSAILESAQMDPVTAVFKEAGWNFLGAMARVTRLSREIAADIFRHPASAPFRPLLPPSVQAMYQQETVRETIDDYDTARIFLAKWAAELAAQSEHTQTHDMRYRHVGVWGNEAWEEVTTKLGSFEILNSENDHSILTDTRTAPVTRQQWQSFFDQDGKLSVSNAKVKAAIFAGGLEPDVRKEAWLFLVGVYPWNSSLQERETLDKQKREAYQHLKAKWMDDKERLASEEFKDQKHRIDKDVHRTDRSIPQYAKEDMPNPSSDSSVYINTNKSMETLKDILCTYNVYNTDLGYVQGMSDLLSPLYIVIEDEALVFWAFESFMTRMKSNFLMDQSGMFRQLQTVNFLLQFMDPALFKHFVDTDSENLFFCFRWLLVWFKREFSWDDILSLWEVLWTDHLTPHFHIFVALSILDKHRDYIIEYLKTFDEILKYINDLSMNMELQEILQRGEILFYQFKQRVQSVETKREQLEAAASDPESDDRARQEAKNDLGKLPVINGLLRDLLPES